MHEVPGWAVGFVSSWEELSQSFGMEKIVLFGCEGLSCGFLGRGLCGSFLYIPGKSAFGNSSGQVKLSDCVKR